MNSTKLEWRTFELMFTWISVAIVIGVPLFIVFIYHPPSDSFSVSNYSFGKTIVDLYIVASFASLTTATIFTSYVKPYSDSFLMSIRVLFFVFLVVCAVKASLFNGFDDPFVTISFVVMSTFPFIPSFVILLKTRGSSVDSKSKFKYRSVGGATSDMPGDTSEGLLEHEVEEGGLFSSCNESKVNDNTEQVGGENFGGEKENTEKDRPHATLGRLAKWGIYANSHILHY